jgi:hypothetical protein
MVASPGDSKKWTIFLSHSSEDKTFVDWLYEKLRSVNQTAWYDKCELLVGDPLLERVEEGLKGSEFLIVVVSQAAIKSNWVKAELEPKLLQQIEGKYVTVLPLALGEAKTEDLSLFLRGKIWLRFPHQGSDEQFQELYRGIEGHLKRRGLIE